MKRPVPSSDAVLRYDGVSVALPRLQGPLFSPLTFQLRAGELIVLSAASGRGKSPALRAAIGAQPRTSGEVVCLGETVSSLSPRALLALRRRVGFVPLTGGLLSNLNLHDNLTLLWRYHDAAPHAQIEARAQEVCDQLGIGDLHDRGLATANHHERHLIAIGRAWLPRPALLVLDEPDFGLDDDAAATLWSRLAALRLHHGAAMLVASSRPSLAVRSGGTHLPLQHDEVA